MERPLDPTRFTEFKTAFARQVQGIQEPEEWEIPEGLFNVPESVRARTRMPADGRRQAVQVSMGPQPEGPEGQKSLNEFVNGQKIWRKDGRRVLRKACIINLRELPASGGSNSGESSSCSGRDDRSVHAAIVDTFLLIVATDHSTGY